MWAVLCSFPMLGKGDNPYPDRGLKGHTVTTTFEFDVGGKQPYFQRQVFSDLEHYMIIYQNSVHYTQILKEFVQ